MRIYHSIVIRLLPVTLCAALSVTAWAGPNPDDVILRLEANNNEGTGMFEVTYSAANMLRDCNGYTWTLPNAVVLYDIVDPTQPVATLFGGSMTFQECAQSRIEISLGLLAGDSDTVFTIEAATIQFTSPGASALGRCSGAFGIEDVDCDGGDLTELDPTSGMGMAQFYFNGAPPEGTFFAGSISSVHVGPCVNGSGWQTYPSSGFDPLPEYATDMTVRIGFICTPHDAATASTNFWINRTLYRIGDLNCDGAINTFDVDPFVDALVNPSLYAARNPGCSGQLADINEDGEINFFDIDPFVILIDEEN